EQAAADPKTRLQREVAALREEAAALDARARNARQVVDELEQRRAELRAEALAPAATGAEPPFELRVALDRAADRDLGTWAAELADRQRRLARADARRREDAYDLWQLRLRLEAWQSKLVAYEMRWHTEREQLEADLARREALVATAANADALPFALPETDAPA